MNKIPALFDLSGKLAIVTGAGSGLGRVFALTFAQAGAQVVVADRDLARAEETTALIEEAGGQAVPDGTDVSDWSQVQALAEGIAESHGGAHILVNNAGIATHPNRLHQIPLEDWDELISINLTGVFYCCRAVIPLMLQAGGGSIINISSIAGLIGHYPGFSMLTANYSAAKAGLIGLTRQMAVEYAKDNIRANAIAPGWHGGTRLSERSRANLSNRHIAQFEDNITSLTPMGRRGLPEELGGLALYLASDASSFLTGQVIAHDGGWTAM